MWFSKSITNCRSVDVGILRLLDLRLRRRIPLLCFNRTHVGDISWPLPRHLTTIEDTQQVTNCDFDQNHASLAHHCTYFVTTCRRSHSRSHQCTPRRSMHGAQSQLHDLRLHTLLSHTLPHYGHYLCPNYKFAEQTSNCYLSKWIGAWWRIATGGTSAQERLYVSRSKRRGIIESLHSDSN